jgi:hypothetical protein
MGSLRSSFRLLPIGLLVAFGLAQPRGLHAQEPSGMAPAHLSAVDGAATLEREDTREAAAAGVPFMPGDRIATDGGRVEVLFPDGSTLAVDEYSVVDLQADALLRLVSGRVLLVVAGAGDPSRAARYQIDTPIASITSAGAGEFRVTLLTGRTELEAELAVVRGAASFTTETGSTLVRAGQRSLAADRTAPSPPEGFNSARLDEFDRWAAARRGTRRAAVTSAQYLPSELRMYSADLDRSGSWDYEAPYGYVWYPTVAAGWRPYYNGYWSSVPRYGWTWIGLDFWGWPTHHYGRWGFSRNRWFWAPDRRFGAAWVSWASAPGYVGWCPLGFDNRPVFGLSVSIGNPWLGWAVVPRHQFGIHASYVSYYPASGHRLPSPSTFAVHSASPVPPLRAVPRGSAQSGSPGRVAVARDGFRAVSPTPAATAQPGRAVSRTSADLTFKQPLPASAGSPHEAQAPPNAGARRPRGSESSSVVGQPGLGRPVEPRDDIYVRGARSRRDASPGTQDAGTSAPPAAPAAATAGRWRPTSRAPADGSQADGAPSSRPAPSERRAQPRSAPPAQETTGASSAPSDASAAPRQGSHGGDGSRGGSHAGARSRSR